MKQVDSLYFPRRIHVVVPLGEAVHEFIIVGKDEIGALAKITAAMARHNLNLINGGTYDANVKEDFVFSVFADLAKADCTQEEIASELRALPFVSLVLASSTEDSVYDRHLFPVLVIEDNRAVIIPAESILFIERDLQRQIGSQGLNVIFEAGRSSGLNLAALHRNMTPEANRDALLRTAVDDMRARGWGLVAFEIGVASAKTTVTVREPVFTGIEGVQSSWWLMGLISGFLEAVYGHRSVVSGKTSFGAESHVFTFQLAEYHPDSRSNRDLV